MLLKRLFAWFNGRPRLRAFLFMVSVSIPAAILGAGKWYPALESWLRNHPYITAVIVGLPVLNPIYAWVQGFFRKRELTPTELHTLLAALGQVVGVKLERFGSAVSSLKDFRCRTVFEKITNPDRQIDEIVEAIYRFFVVTKPTDISEVDLGIRVVLAVMGPQHIESFGPFYPSDTRPRSKPKDLNNENSAFSRAKATKGIIVVEDICSEKLQPEPRFVVTHESRSMENGSIICYPITVRQTGEVPFVLSISVKRKNYFLQADAEVFVSILKHFEQRIVLEYFLKQLKQKTTRKNEANEQTKPNSERAAENGQGENADRGVAPTVPS